MTDTAAQRKRSQLQGALRDALRARERLRVSVLRSLIAAIDNAEAVALPSDAPRNGPRTRAISERVAITGDGPSEVARRELSEAEVHDVIAAEIAAMRAAAAELRAHGADPTELEAKTKIAQGYA